MSFDLDRARRCLVASAAAYKDAEMLSLLASSPTWIETPLAHVMIVDSGYDLIIAFRGTANIRDWITDGECWMADEERDMKACKENGAEIHVGFLRAMTSVFDKVLSALTAHPAALVTSSIIVTGHSLGGALAMLFAKAFVGWAKLDGRENPVAAVYTFGQPRVGNSVFAKNYDQVLGDRTWRFVNQEDVVPRVPGLLAGYRHAGNEVFLSAPGTFMGLKERIKINPPIWFKALSDAVGLYKEWKQGKVALLADHFVAAYQARLLPAEAISQKQTEETKV